MKGVFSLPLTQSSSVWINLFALLLPGRLFLADVPGNIDLLHLRAAFDDLHDLGVAQISLHLVFTATTIRSMNLDSVIGCFERRAGSKILGDGSLSDCFWIADIFQVTSLVAKQSRGFDVGDHLGKHLLDQRVLPKIRAKRPENIRVAKKTLYTGLADADAAPRNRVPAI